MKKYSWLFVILGVAALGIALVFGAAFGAGITYFFLQADPVQAAFVMPVEVEDGDGVLISSVKPDSAAAEAGLVRGDIILEINGDPINNIIEVKEFLVKLDPGDVVELTVLHGDETRVLEVELDDVKGFAFLGIGTCNSLMDKKSFPGGPMSDVFIEAFPVGAEIMEVVPESSAEEVGLQVGDLILSVNEKLLGPKMDLADLIQKYEPGDTIILEVLSGMDEEPREIEVVLAQHPEKPGQAYLGVAYQMGTPLDFEGGEFPFMEMMPFIEGFEGELPEGWEEKDFYFHHDDDFDGELPEGFEGAVIISEVMEDTPAAEANMQPGDLIIAIDGEPVEEIDDFVEELQSHKPGDEVTLTIIREIEEIEVTITLTEHPDDPEKGFLGVLAGTFIIMENMEVPEGFNQNFEFELPGIPGGDA